MSIPKWRYVRYTDDGCSLYQCLNCYNGWEARTEPGWFDTTRLVDEPCEGSLSYTDGPTGKKVHFVRRDNPVFKPVWTFCPYCGVAWEGPVIVDPFNDNEHMYGPERLTRYTAVRLRQQKAGWRQPEYTGLWWVIQTRSTWKGDEPSEKDWSVKEYAKAERMPAAKMLHLLNEARAETDPDEHDYADWEARLVTTYVEPSGGYEICNYDWNREEPEYARSKSRHNP